jgi:hypothetical protein
VFHVEALGAELLWKVRALLGTTVAAWRLSRNGPQIVPAGHVEGEPRILVYWAAAAALRAGLTTSAPPATSPLGYRVLPIATLTPGTTDTRVTPETITTTICVSGWSASVRPPTSVTDPIKTERIAAYGYDSASKTLFELDHLIPLELGGGPADVANLWPEPYDGTDGARIKDNLENKLHDLICAGTTNLRAAQTCIAVDWIACAQDYGIGA